MTENDYNEIRAILFRESRPDLVNKLIGTQGYNNATQLSKAIELLEACSEDLYIGSGDDIELETRVDNFIKEVKP